MSFNPRNLYDPANYRIVKDIVRVYPSNSVKNVLDLKMIADPEKFKFASVHHVFGCVRNEMHELGVPSFLIKNSARYAISDDQLKIPSLYNPNDYTFIFDPLLPYRNPVIELYKGGTVYLLHSPAQSHYFAPGALQG